jgi:hypothetical protein
MDEHKIGFDEQIYAMNKNNEEALDKLSVEVA